MIMARASHQATRASHGASIYVESPPFGECPSRGRHVFTEPFERDPDYEAWLNAREMEEIE